MKLIHGVGVNDADYPITKTVNGKQITCLAYTTWQHMLTRCYSASLHAKFPSYVGVEVCKEWRSFMSFKSWWLRNHVDGWHLDKDILTDRRLYSSDNCIYIPGWLNTFTTNSGASRGAFLVGVEFHKPMGAYRARCRHPLGPREHLGYFSTEIEAHNAWRARKLEIAKELKEKMDEIDTRIYPRVLEIITAMR